MSNVGRNSPCPCGSGKKYKHCCANKATKSSLKARLAFSLIALMLIGGLIVALTSIDELDSPRAGPARVWSEEHQHWH